MKVIVWDLKDYSITCIYFALALWVLVFDRQTTAQSSHTETYVTYQMGTRTTCRNETEDCYPETFTESKTATRCERGWSPEPVCNEFDECKEGTSRCEHNCTDTVSSYKCSCYTGYSLAPDGQSCNEFDECREGTSQCQHNCTNTVGSYKCSCKTGYRLASDGRSCNDFDECTAGTSGCNHTCSNTNGSYTCSCNAGYRLASDGRSCDGLPDSRGTSEAKVAIAVTICLLVVITFIIIAVVFFVRRAKKRKRNERDPTTNNTVLAATNVYHNKEPDSTPSELKSSRSKISSEILYEEFEDVRSQATNTSTSQLESSETVYENQADAFKPKTRPETKPKPKPKSNDLNTQDQCCSTNVSSSTAGNGKADSKETATGQSILANVYKGIQKAFKFKKGNKDLRNGEATNDSIYQDLVAVTESNCVYEPIRKPSKSNEVDLSVQ